MLARPLVPPVYCSGAVASSEACEGILRRALGENRCGPMNYDIPAAPTGSWNPTAPPESPAADTDAMSDKNGANAAVNNPSSLPEKAQPSVNSKQSDPEMFMSHIDSDAVYMTAENPPAKEIPSPPAADYPEPVSDYNVSDISQQYSGFTQKQYPQQQQQQQQQQTPHQVSQAIPANMAAYPPNQPQPPRQSYPPTSFGTSSNSTHLTGSTLYAPPGPPESTSDSYSTYGPSCSGPAGYPHAQDYGTSGSGMAGHESHPQQSSSFNAPGGPYQKQSNVHPARPEMHNDSQYQQSYFPRLSQGNNMGAPQVHDMQFASMSNVSLASSTSYQTCQSGPASTNVSVDMSGSIHSHSQQFAYPEGYSSVNGHNVQYPQDPPPPPPISAPLHSSTSVHSGDYSASVQPGSYQSHSCHPHGPHGAHPHANNLTISGGSGDYSGHLPCGPQQSLYSSSSSQTSIHHGPPVGHIGVASNQSLYSSQTGSLTGSVDQSAIPPTNVASPPGQYSSMSSHYPQPPSGGQEHLYPAGSVPAGVPSGGGANDSTTEKVEKIAAQAGKVAEKAVKFGAKTAFSLSSKFGKKG